MYLSTHFTLSYKSCKAIPIYISTHVQRMCVCVCVYVWKARNKEKQQQQQAPPRNSTDKLCKETVKPASHQSNIKSVLCNCQGDLKKYWHAKRKKTLFPFYFGHSFFSFNLAHEITSIENKNLRYSVCSLDRLNFCVHAFYSLS